MVWTYTNSPFSGDPYSSPPVYPSPQQNRDTVRFLVGDTDSTDPQLQDSEVDGLLNANNSTNNPTPDCYLAAAQGCISLSSRYARKASMSVGDLSIQYDQLGKHYQDLRKQIIAQAARHAAVPVPYAGGISQSDMQQDEMDDDLVQPWASVGMHDDRGNAPDYGGGGADEFTQVVPS